MIALSELIAAPTGRIVWTAECLSVVHQSVSKHGQKRDKSHSLCTNQANSIAVTNRRGSTSLLLQLESDISSSPDASLERRRKSLVLCFDI